MSLESENRLEKPKILDGGLATWLESLGHDLDHFLWSARILRDDPRAIVQAHRDFIQAGADWVTTASYQASHVGFRRLGIDDRETDRLIGESVHLARSAIEQVGTLADGRTVRVAASIGPFGAALADGSEYRGAYGVSPDELRRFHRRRWKVLAACQPDAMLCETIPSMDEVKVLAELAESADRIKVWLSLCCRDARHLADGTPLAECVAFVDKETSFQAIGINCLSPKWVIPAIETIRQRTARHVIAYPNSGERFNPEGKTWSGATDLNQFAEWAESWWRAGAMILGGCCRVFPEHIRAIRERFRGDRSFQNGLADG